MKLSGKNFQPWADFNLDLEKLTVLTGPSNKGKSSLFRALLGILRNELDASFIRDPKEEPMELTLEIGDLKIKATRNKRGKVVYVINDDEKNAYSSLDGAIPGPMQSLACGEITIGEFSFDPIFGRQNAPQFLLDKKAYKPGDLNAILGAFGGTERLEAGKKEAASRVSERNGEAKTLAAEIRKAEERKLNLEPLALQGSGVATGLNTLERDIRGLEARSVWFNQSAGHLRRCQRLLSLQEQLPLPDPTEAEKLVQTASYALQGADSYRYAKFLKKLLGALDGVSAPWTEAASQWKLLTTIESARTLLENRREVPDISGIEITFADAIRQYQSIKRIGEIVALRESVKERQSQLTQIDTELTQMQEEIRKSACPKCGKQMEHVCG